MAGWMKRFRRRKNDRPYCAAVVPAAGSARRMEGVDKVLANLGGMPVLARTLLALERCEWVDEIVVVTRSDLCVPVGKLCSQFGIGKARKVVTGGDTRAESVRQGLRALSRQVEYVAIHDGARPFPSQQLLARVFAAGVEFGAAAPAVPVKDTVKRAENDVVLETLDRSTLYAVQTPQVFPADFLSAALYDAIQAGAELTDDCSAVERLGKQVRLVEGEYENIKITTPVDLAIGEAIIQWQEQI